MPENILKKIIDIKKVKINKLKKDISISHLSEKISANKYYPARHVPAAKYLHEVLSL